MLDTAHSGHPSLKHSEKTKRNQNWKMAIINNKFFSLLFYDYLLKRQHY